MFIPAVTVNVAEWEIVKNAKNVRGKTSSCRLNSDFFNANFAGIKLFPTVLQTLSSFPLLRVFFVSNIHNICERW